MCSKWINASLQNDGSQLKSAMRKNHWARSWVFVVFVIVLTLAPVGWLFGAKFVHTAQAKSFVMVGESRPTKIESSNMALEKDARPSLKARLGNVLKPVLVEVGVIALFQSTGVPAYAKHVGRVIQVGLQTGRRSLRVAPSWLRFVSFKNGARYFRQAGRGIRLRSPPRMLRRFQETVRRLYRRRSRLSAASDFTHVVGDEAPENETTV